MNRQQGTDDLGKGGFNDSLTVGHSGARSACGIIGKVLLRTLFYAYYVTAS